jgi:hypothetical protein
MNMTEQAEVTMNFNAAECIKSVTHWGHTTYHNICNHTVVDLPWGFVYYGFAFFLVATIAIVVIRLIIAALAGDL